MLFTEQFAHREYNATRSMDAYGLTRSPLSGSGILSFFMITGFKGLVMKAIILKDRGVADADISTLLRARKTSTNIGFGSHIWLGVRQEGFILASMSLIGCYLFFRLE